MKIKFILAVAFSVAVVSTCTAQEIQAPVNVSMELYKSCMVAFLQNEPYPNTAATIDKRMKELDGMCNDWATIWLPSMLNEKEYRLSVDGKQRFAERRHELRESITTELVMMVGSEHRKP